MLKVAFSSHWCNSIYTAHKYFPFLSPECGNGLYDLVTQNQIQIFLPNVDQFQIALKHICKIKIK